MQSTLSPARRASLPASRSLLSPLLLLAALGWLWFSLCRQLSYEWSANEQYNYGWFVPFLAAFLFWLRLETKVESSRNAAAGEAGPSNEKVENGASASSGFLLSTLAFLLLAALLPIRLFEVANPDWRPLSWLHALIVVGLTLLTIAYCGGRHAARHFAFPVCFILVAVPWVTPIETPIVQGLMKLVAAVATEMLTICGIPAHLEGSLIRVSSGVVGVSEACSGVRSLQTSLMIGLLFGELKRLSVGRRIALVGAALAIALLANFVRAFFLVWIAATNGLAAVARWHDFAGYAIVLLAFLGTIAIATKLGARSTDRQDLTTASNFRSLISDFRFPPLSFLLSTFAFLLFAEGSVFGWYRWHERNYVPTIAWSARWPEDAAGFRELPIDDNIRSTLRYSSGREASWRLSLTSEPNEPVTDAQQRPGFQRIPAGCTMFFFRWAPGAASILRARAHRPDICLPNTGWELLGDKGTGTYRVDAKLSLPFRHFRFRHRAAGGGEVFADAFFCEREDRVPAGASGRFDATAGQTGNWMRDDRLRAVLQGLRNQGQQVLELVLIEPNETRSDTVEANFAELVPRLVEEKQTAEQK